MRRPYLFNFQGTFVSLSTKLEDWWGKKSDPQFPVAIITWVLTWRQFKHHKLVITAALIWHERDAAQCNTVERGLLLFLFSFQIACLRCNHVQFNIYWTFTAAHGREKKYQGTWNFISQSGDCKKTTKKVLAYHPYVKSEQRTFERQNFWRWLVPHSCQSRRVVFIFPLQQKTVERGERPLKRPWTEPYAVAVTFIASHIIWKTVQKKPLVFGHLNPLKRAFICCSALATLAGSVQWNLDFIFPSLWTMPL